MNKYNIDFQDTQNDFYNKVLIYDLKWETPLEGFSLKISIGDGSDVDSQGKTTSLLRSRGVPAGYPLEVHYTDYDTIYSMEYKINNWSFVAEYQRTEVEVEETIRFCQADGFWSGNAGSSSGLPLR